MVDLRAFRRANKLTQQDIADYLGCDQSFVSQMESGLRPLPQDQIDKILANEGWDTSAIFTDDLNISISGSNSGVVAQMHGGTINHNGGKDQVIEKQEQQVVHMFEAFMVELRGFHEYIKMQDGQIKIQDDHLKEIVKHSYLRNKKNMERLDNIVSMMNDDRQKSREQLDRLITMLEKKL